MTREDLVKQLDVMSNEVNDLSREMTTVSGMLAVLRQSTKETDLAMNNMISLIENSVNNLIGKHVSNISSDISKIMKQSDSLEVKVAKPRKPRAVTGDKPKQTRQRRKKVEEKPIEQVEKEVVAE